MLEFNEPPQANDSYVFKLRTEFELLTLLETNCYACMKDAKSGKSLQKIPIELSDELTIRSAALCTIRKTQRGLMFNIEVEDAEEVTIDGTFLPDYFSFYNEGLLPTEHSLFDDATFSLNLRIHGFDNKYYLVGDDEDKKLTIEIFTLKGLEDILNNYMIKNERLEDKKLIIEPE